MMQSKYREDGNRIGRDGMGRYAEKWEGWDGLRKIWTGMGRDGRGGRDKAVKGGMRGIRGKGSDREG